MEPHDLDDAELRDRAVAAARGKSAFDLLIRGGIVADVECGEFRSLDVGVVGPIIASVHPRHSRDDAGKTLEVAGLIVSPGLIDSHMHIESSMVLPSAYAKAVVSRGVTTAVWDPHEFGNVAGLPGIQFALDAAAESGLRILTLAPSCVPSAPGYETAGADFGPETVSDLLNRPEIAGLAEVMDMSGVIARESRLRGIVQAGLQSGKLVCGHARGLDGSSLQAYAAAGVQSDHEITSASDLRAKLLAGLTIELRGSHPHLLPECAKALQSLTEFPSTITLCTDDVFPDELEEKGGVNETVRLLVSSGLSPIRALRAATANAAIRLGRRDLGIIAPGRRADIAIFRDLERFEAVHVLCNGRRPSFGTVAESNGLAPVSDRGRLEPKDFEITATGPTARVATIDKPRFTSWSERRVPVINGHLKPDDDMLRIAVIHRHGNPRTRPRVGFLTGWGRWDGAFATTVSHDSHNLTVFGSRTTDMALAANTAIESRGGLAVASSGKVLANLPLPVAGLVSTGPVSEVAASFRKVRAAMDNVADWRPPYLVFKALFGATLACNPGPHQTDLGIADPAEGVLLVSPIVEDGIGENVG